MDFAACYVDDAFVVHLVELAAEIETALGYQPGHVFHPDVEGLGACGAQTAAFHEAHNLLSDGGCWLSPGLVTDALTLGADDVEQVEPEDFLFCNEFQYLLLVDAEDAALFKGSERLGIALRQPEEALRLDDVGSCHLFGEAITSIIGAAFHFDRATGKEIDVLAGVAFADNRFVACYFQKAEFGVCNHLVQVVVAHSLEEWELEQLLKDVF